MQNRFILLMLFFFTVSCNYKGGESGEDTIYSTDTICIKEIKRAKSDIQNNKLVFCHYIGNIMWQALRAEKEMDSLLKLFNIEYQDESSPCVIQEHREYHCYCEFMQERIIEKYGEKFTDSLLNVADSLYILKHPDKTFDNGSESNSWDKPPVFPGDTTFEQSNHSGLQHEFDKCVEYPNGYRFKQGENSEAMIKLHLTVDEKGKAKATVSEFIVWDNRYKDVDDNKKFDDYFKKKAITLIEKTIWTPAKVKSVCVKSESDIFIYMK